MESVNTEINNSIWFRREEEEEPNRR